MRQAGKRILGFALRHWPLTVIVLAGALLFMNPRIVERRFVYYPTREIHANPSQIGLPFQDVYFDTDDGVRLNGWFVPSEGSNVTLLVFHGNAGNLEHRIPWIGMLHALPANIWIIDYRGYGRSSGSPHEKGLYLDAEASYRWWDQQYGSKGGKLVVVGESLGGAVAVDLASRRRVDGLILQSTFTSMRDMAKTLLPIGLLQPLFGFHFDSAAKIPNLACPKLLIHGDIDEIVPLRLGRKLFELASEPKEYWEVSGAGHNDLPWAAGPEYNSRLSKFLNRFR